MSFFRRTFIRKSLPFAKSILLFAKLIENILFLLNRSQILFFHKTFFRKYLLFAKSAANTFFSRKLSLKTSFRKIVCSNLLAKPSFAKIFFSQNRSCFSQNRSKKNFFFAKSIANIFFLQNLFFGNNFLSQCRYLFSQNRSKISSRKTSFQNVFFSQNRLKIPSFRETHR